MFTVPWPTLEMLTPCLALRKKQSRLRALCSETGPGMGRRGLWGLLLYLRRSRRASRRREQGHRGLQGEEGNPLCHGASRGTLGALPGSWCAVGAGVLWVLVSCGCWAVGAF